MLRTAIDSLFVGCCAIFGFTLSHVIPVTTSAIEVGPFDINEPESPLGALFFLIVFCGLLMCALYRGSIKAHNQVADALKETMQLYVAQMDTQEDKWREKLEYSAKVIEAASKSIEANTKILAVMGEQIKLCAVIRDH